MRTLAAFAACAALSVPALALAQAAPAAAPADAAVAATPAQPAAKPVKTKNGDRVCKLITSTESRLGGTRECHTKAEWDDIAREAREETQRHARTGLSGSH